MIHLTIRPATKVNATTTPQKPSILRVVGIGWLFRIMPDAFRKILSAQGNFAHAQRSGLWCNNSISPCEGDGPGANPGFLTNNSDLPLSVSH
jgi:hypothetical protein